MYSCKYGSEPTDLKLMALYILKRFMVILAVTLITAGIFAGGYYLCAFVFVPEPQYTAKSVLYVNYDEKIKLENIYINDYTWQQLSKTDVVTDYVIEHMASPVTREFMEEAVFAGLESDVRIVNLRVTTTDPKLSVELAGVYEQALVAFGEEMDDIEGVDIYTHATTAEKPEVDNRILHMTLSGAIVGALFSFFGVCFAFIMDDSIYVPITFEQRFGFPVLGTFTGKKKEIFSGELSNQIAEHLRECEQVVLSGVQENQEAEEVLKLIELNGITLPKNLTFETADCVSETPETIHKLLGYDGVVLAVPSGCKNSRMIERTIHFIDSNGGNIKGAILYQADEFLLKKYYHHKKAKREVQ